MFLSTLSIFPWDLAITLLIATGFAMTVVCTAFLWVKPRRHWFARLCVWILRLVPALFTLTVIYGSFVEPQLLFVTRLPISLPIEHPLRIVVLSDFHVGPYKGKAYVERVVRQANALLPDVVLLAGDYVLQDHLSLASIEPLSPLQDLRPSLGTFAVMGNHDHGVYRQLQGMHSETEDRSDMLVNFFQQLNITVLSNQHAVLSLGTQSIAIAGVDDLSAQHANLSGALTGIAQDMPIILLTHTPDVVLDPLSRRAALIVSGHTHGGQIRLPWIGALAPLPTKIGKAYDQGLFTLRDGTQLAITRGVGESGARARLLAPPEVMLLEYSGLAQPAQDDDVVLKESAK